MKEAFSDAHCSLASWPLHTNDEMIMLPFPICLQLYIQTTFEGGLAEFTLNWLNVNSVWTFLHYVVQVFSEMLVFVEDCFNGNKSLLSHVYHKWH